ncbi:MAG: hypothetical protein QOI66_3070 [Myxococcales bacterium]|nr:hypothetical protein [Myxococcales bacterium]
MMLMRRSTAMVCSMVWMAGLAGLLLATPALAQPNKKKSSAPTAAPATAPSRDEALPPSTDADAAAPAGTPAPEKTRPVVNDIPQPPEPKAPAQGPSGPSAADLDKLRADYDRLREELFRARARAQIVAEATYSSRLSATLRWKGGADQLIRHAQVRLDGGEVWDSGDKPVTGDFISVAERGVKPGPHALTVRLEVHPGKKTKDAEKLGYVSEHTFAIVVADHVKTRVEITADEDGDPPEYEPNLEVEIETTK